uniref:Uncharacterized protein n=1 Tax=Triticum urartu TaxID=4572 RepID=A0A8R7U9J8_TRIUA
GRLAHQSPNQRIRYSFRRLERPLPLTCHVPATYYVLLHRNGRSCSTGQVHERSAPACTGRRLRAPSPLRWHHQVTNHLPLLVSFTSASIRIHFTSCRLIMCGATTYVREDCTFATSARLLSAPGLPGTARACRRRSSWSPSIWRTSQHGTRRRFTHRARCLPWSTTARSPERAWI